MGGTSSKIEEDKGLLLCRERRRFVRRALDGRCSLADAHVSYIEALKHTGVTLGKFFEPDVPVESSLYSSTSATPEPLVLTDKSASQFSMSSRSPSRNVEILDSYSPSLSPFGSQINVNHMKSGRNKVRTVEERPPISVTATVHSLDSSPKPSPKLSPLLNGNSSFLGSTLAPETPPWDYFGFFHPIDNQFSYGDDKVSNLGSEKNGDIRQTREKEGLPELESHHSRPLQEEEGIPQLEVEDIRRFREAEGIPELEEEGDKSSVNGRSDSAESEDDFDRASEPLVRIFKNRTQTMDLDSMDDSSDATPLNNQSEESKANAIVLSSKNENYASHKPVASRVAAAVSAAPANGTCDLEKDIGSDSKVSDKDFLSSIKDIRELFIKASESGKHVPRMLEANKVNFRPLFTEGKVHRSNGSILFMAFRCCREEPHGHEEPITTEVKYITWNRSVSSLSSSSQGFLGTAAVGSADLFSNSCMNAGSHASTLDRLYAWEKKLYDEVKASGIVRKEYDMKCKLLRQQESRHENSNRTDKTRAKVKDSYSRVKVAIHRINSISKTIEELRDKELQPQLEELIEGLQRMWAEMLECHRLQVDIISTVCNDGAARILMRPEFFSLAAADLERELNFLCSSFRKWISAQRSYLQAINEWLHKCVLFPHTVKQRSLRKKEDFCPARYGAPPIYITCEEWLKELDNLPTKDLVEAVKNLAEETARFVPPQEKQQGNVGAVLSISRRFGSSGELAQELLKRGSFSDLNVGMEGLQSRLQIFLMKLHAFSDKSVVMYSKLGEAILTARTRYESVR